MILNVKKKILKMTESIIKIVADESTRDLL